MQLYVLATVLGHVLLAAAVGSHAEVYGRNPWRWSPIVLVTGVVGVLWYARSATVLDDEATSEATPVPAEPPSEWLEDRSRRRRLADPNTLHIDLPDGTTLTGSEQRAVGAVVERLQQDEETPADDAAGGDGDPAPDGEWEDDQQRGASTSTDGESLAGPTTTPSVDDWSTGSTTSRDRTSFGQEDDQSVDTGTLLETVFEEHDAGYHYPDIWWTDCIRPALEVLPEVEPPPDADEHTVELTIREVYHDGDGTMYHVTDGDRDGRFRCLDGRIEAASSDVYAETSPGWARFAKERLAEKIADSGYGGGTGDGTPRGNSNSGQESTEHSDRETGASDSRSEPVRDSERSVEFE